MPRFSVIVPIYNVERYVGECIESLRSQTFDDFEVVCVDDGSTDRSLDRAREAAGGDERFVFVMRENGGLSAARNTGLKHAQGDYVSFLDSDDRYRPDALSLLDARLREDELDLLDFSASTFYDSAKARRAHRESYDYRDSIPGVRSGQGLFVEYWQRMQFVSSACFHVIRRDMLECSELAFCEGLLHEDELFTPQLYAHAERAAFLNEPLYERRMREGSIMTARTSLANVKSLYAIAQMLHAWLINNARLLTPDFIDAFALDIAYVRDSASRACGRLESGELDAYLEGLDAADRVDFDLVARFAGAPADRRYHEVADSRDYRLGHAALTIPRAVKGALR